MFWKWFRFITLALITACIFYVSHNGIAYLSPPVPAFGKLLHPKQGFWANNESLDHFSESISLQVNNQVSVHWDRHQIPHIFAQNDYDLYYTQGYITAKHRLWQMDFLSRLSGGRLAEIMGNEAIDIDLFHRNIRLKQSAQKALDTLQHFPEVYSSLTAYSAGVNAYIDELSPTEYPVEFKLLNYKPEHWSPLKSALILKYMAWDLDGGTDDRLITNAKQAYPDSIFNDLYPTTHPFLEPIITPKQKPKPKKRTQPIQWISPTRFIIPTDQYQKGSNNWAVDGKKSRSGNPILANDPHLSLSLPSLWYQNQLSNGKMNVYGVSLPGVPMVVIGFTADAAWGLTYTTSDPIDFCKVELNPEKTQYKLDGKYVNALIQFDTIEVKASKPIIQKQIETAYGPVVYIDSLPRKGFNQVIPSHNVAMNWTAHQPSLEFVTMYELNRASNLEDFKTALRYHSAPGQNFVFANNNGDIALWHNGKFPIREANEARFVQDSLTSNLLWDKFIPFEQLPHEINPKKHFVSSANQSPVTSDYPYYLGSDDYASFERSARINQVLDSLDFITYFDFQQLQLDNYSLLAEKLLPGIIQTLSNAKLSSEELDVLNELKSWDYQYTAQSKSALFFNEYMSHLQQNIWLDEAYSSSQEFMLPRIDVTTQLLLTDSLSIYFDNIQTPNIVEQRNDVILSSFQDAVSSLVSTYGSLNEDWAWNKANPTIIKSLGRMRGFGSEPLETGGSKRSVNAISGSNGPSWRMIVELGNTPKGYGIYPGGQSGNPGSVNYDSFIKDWAEGVYYPLHFLSTPAATEDIVSTTKIKHQ